MGSVEIGDLISEQISISEENDESSRERQNSMDSEKASDKKISTDAVTTMKESKNKKNQKVMKMANNSFSLNGPRKHRFVRAHELRKSK